MWRVETRGEWEGVGEARIVGGRGWHLGRGHRNCGPTPSCLCFFTSAHVILTRYLATSLFLSILHGISTRRRPSKVGIKGELDPASDHFEELRNLGNSIKDSL